MIRQVKCPWNGDAVIIFQCRSHLSLHLISFMLVISITYCVIEKEMEDQSTHYLCNVECQ